MATLGRDIYHKFLLDGDGEVAQNLFINAIRFSTHGDFYCKNTTLTPSVHSYPHFHDFNNVQNVEEFYKVFYFRGNKYSFEKYDKGVLIDLKFSKNSISEKYSSYHYIDFIVNDDKKITYVCSIDGRGFPYHAHSDIDEVLNKVPEHLFSLDKGTVITLNFSFGTPLITFNTVSKHWDYYRVLGINIPLLVLQILLGRNIRTFPLVDLEKVSFNESTPKYIVNPKAIIWFDLDETLVCRWKPIHQTVRLFKAFRDKGFNLRLITRHTYDIPVTLEQIGLNSADFDGIVKVEKHQKKSNFIATDDLFIDNEFGERIDVRTNCKATVLDLDQIEFLYI